MKANNVPDGLVTFRQYNQLVKSDSFKQVESFSDNFIAKAGPLIGRYNFRWVADPLHQWSRQWEYHYVINRIKSQDSTARIVDLGAGISFLPYYLKKTFGFKNIFAVDYDKGLVELYKKVNRKIGCRIDFRYGDMRNLTGFKRSSVDFVYSVSVLEHTSDYEKILKQIYDILKPGGKLCFTFDISLDGLDEIPLNKAKQLVSITEKVFKTDLPIDFKSINNKDLVTSQKVAKINKRLLPWKFPLVNLAKHLIKHGRLGSLYKNLTFCCLTVTKK